MHDPKSLELLEYGDTQVEIGIITNMPSLELIGSGLVVESPELKLAEVGV